MVMAAIMYMNSYQTHPNNKNSLQGILEIQLAGKIMDRGHIAFVFPRRLIIMKFAS